METVEEEMGKKLQEAEVEERVGFPEGIFNVGEGYSVVKFGYNSKGSVDIGFLPVDYAGYVGLRTNECTLPLFAAMTSEFGRRIRLKQSDRTRIMQEIVRDAEQAVIQESGLTDNNQNQDFLKSKLLREILQAKVRAGLVDNNTVARAFELFSGNK